MTLPVARETEIAERRAEAVRLKLAGHTWQQVADRLGYSSKGAACQDVGRQLAKAREGLAESIEELRAAELEVLDAAQAVALDVMNTRHLAHSNGRVITVRDSETGDERPVYDDGPRLAAIDRLVRISERRARYSGLDAPVRVEGAARVLVEIVGVDLTKLT